MSMPLCIDSRLGDPDDLQVPNRKPERDLPLTRKLSQAVPSRPTTASRNIKTLRVQGEADKLDLSGSQHGASSPAFGMPATTGAPGSRDKSRAGTVSPPSVFDDNADDERYTAPTTGLESTSPDEISYDLRPPRPSTHTNVEALAVRLFSVDHLNAILRDPVYSSRFARFLEQYRPQQAKVLAKFLDTKKAITAIEYANAVAENIATPSGFPPYLAAALDERFDAYMKELTDDLVEEALPAYVTHRMTQIVTESLVKEVTGTDLSCIIPSLAEVYCVSDPSLPDNPIVYASEGKLV
jgi:hypothetical protein